MNWTVGSRANALLHLLDLFFREVEDGCNLLVVFGVLFGLFLAELTLSPFR